MIVDSQAPCEKDYREILGALCPVSPGIRNNTAHRRILSQPGFTVSQATDFPRLTCTHMYVSAFSYVHFLVMISAKIYGVSTVGQALSSLHILHHLMLM